MGVMNHNAVIATTWDTKRIEGIQKWIESIDETSRELFLIGPAVTNNQQTVVLLPDGSKEHRAESAEGDALRQAFIDRLDQDNYEDDSSPWCWIEVGYGEYGQKVLQGNNVNCFGDENYYEPSPRFSV